MTSLEILNQLLNGHHLKPDELQRAEFLVTILKSELETRTKEASK